MYCNLEGRKASDLRGLSEILNSLNYINPGDLLEYYLIVGKEKFGALA